MNDFVTDAALFAASSLYAKWLAEHKTLEPDWTFLEVGVGVGYCLLHAYVRGHMHGGDWQDGQREALRSLTLGALPIVAGELTQWLQRRDRRRQYRGYVSGEE
jgi:hypothetical protein